MSDLPTGDFSTPSTGTRSGLVNPALAYLASAAIAMIFYTLWFFLRIASFAPGGRVPSILFELEAASFFCIFGGFALALILMIPPWLVAVRLHKPRRSPGGIYFAIVGACLTFLIACSTSSLAPKPLFIENQTFFEGARIAADLQGICFLLAGLLFGLTYWFLSTRRRPSDRNRDPGTNLLPERFP